MTISQRPRSSSIQSFGQQRSSSIREDSLSSSFQVFHSTSTSNSPPRNVESLTYVDDESDAWRAHYAQEHYQHRGRFWNAGKHATCVKYGLMAAIGVVQACVAYCTNITSIYFITLKFSYVMDILEQATTSHYKWGLVLQAYLSFASIQLGFAAIAAFCVWIEPVAAGSGIPEVKIYLVRKKENRRI